MKLEEGEELRLSFPAMVYNVKGTIHITNYRLAWTIEKTDEISISLPFNSIKSQFKNADTSAKIMLREQFRTFIFTSDNAVSDREKIIEALAEELQSLYQQHHDSKLLKENPQLNKILDENKTLLTSNEIQIREDILKNHKDLLKLHMELVINGLLSEEEFWSIRENMLENEKFTQKKGQASSSLADIRPTHNEGNDIKYTMTAEIIHSIFLHYPSVKRAYDKNVPNKITKEDFWKRYFSSKFFHRNRTNGKSHIDKSDAIFDKCLEEDKFTGPSKEEIENVPLLIDLTATEQNQYENLVFEDLTTKKEELQTPLQIKDQKRYFESQISLTNQELKQKILNKEEFGIYLDNFKRWHLNLNSVNNERSYAIFQKVFDKLDNNVVTYNQDKLSQLNKDLNELQTSDQQEINTYQLIYNELLKHFWRYIPITNDEDKEALDKLMRLLRNTEERFNQFYARLKEYQNKTISLKGLFNSINKSIKKAYEVYNDQMKQYNNKRQRLD
ncbi:hypothetical protein LY90DRAFT_702889 [Neocallimastix californiae]|uniref:BSD domain-containing protein n=1 Tax=Neocallimastix californiae TaxID=1754190 RepID=A0A1Y2CUC2_9FUNG|nr:hypothetical protein LY90DRAFT_702889 [Neocallimastix californiae]|eukprot:ORY50631.1 hypothetical protein LY90DRAFT_702889 [Neocallimastix californiae]